MANLVRSAMREAVRLARADPMAPAVRRLGERPTAARMVRRRLFPERRLDVTELGWPVRKLRRAS
jgi:hypothetical protein